MNRICTNGHPWLEGSSFCGDCGAGEGAPVQESEESIAGYRELLEEFLADGILEDWELTELADARKHLGISLATHERLTSELERSVLPLLLEYDETTFQHTEVDMQSVLRLRATNKGERAVRQIRVFTRSTACEAATELRTRIVGPSKSEVVSYVFAATAAGHHHFDLLAEVVDMKGSVTHYRGERLVFNVARARQGPVTSVTHIDASSARVADFSNVKLGASPSPSAGVLGEQWRTWTLSAISQGEFGRAAGGAREGAPASNAGRAEVASQNMQRMQQEQAEAETRAKDERARQEAEAARSRAEEQAAKARAEEQAAREARQSASEERKRSLEIQRTAHAEVKALAEATQAFMDSLSADDLRAPKFGAALPGKKVQRGDEGRLRLVAFLVQEEESPLLEASLVALLAELEASSAELLEACVTPAFRQTFEQRRAAKILERSMEAILGSVEKRVQVKQARAQEKAREASARAEAEARAKEARDKAEDARLEAEREKQIPRLRAEIEARAKARGLGADTAMFATVMAVAIHLGSTKLHASGQDPTALKASIDRAVEAVVGHVLKGAAAITSKQELATLAALGSGGDQLTGRLVSEAFEAVGKTGVVTAEPGIRMETGMEVVEGTRFDRGYMSPHFVDDMDRKVAELEDVYVLLVGEPLSTPALLLPVLEALERSAKRLLLVAPDMNDATLDLMVTGKLRAKYRCCAVKAPGFGDRRTSILKDLATLTGGQVLANERALPGLRSADLGRARRVVVDQDNTTIIGAAGDKGAILARCNLIRQQSAATSSDYDREKLQERLAKLVGGVAVLKVGGSTRGEIDAKVARTERGIRLAQGALEAGIVPGAGEPLIRARAALEALLPSPEDRWGLAVLRPTLEAPLRHLARLAGEDATAVVQKVREGPKGFGFDPTTKRYGNLVTMGVLQPADVLCWAIRAAASVASLFAGQPAPP